VNLLAVAAASENIALNGVARARAFVSDGVPAGAAARYDVVATNPPFHVGKTTDYDIARGFIAAARRALRPGGRLLLVANRFLRYDEPLRAAFDRVDCVVEARGYRVWKAS
jgi:16S rRNA (guanine1207-N2)-methyltransferase